MLAEFFVEEKKKFNTKWMSIVIDDRSEKNSSHKKMHQKKKKLTFQDTWLLHFWVEPYLDFQIPVSIMDFLAEDFQNRFCLESNPKQFICIFMTFIIFILFFFFLIVSSFTGSTALKTTTWLNKERLVKSKTSDSIKLKMELINKKKYTSSYTYNFTMTNNEFNSKKI